MPKAKSGNFTLKRIASAIPAHQAAHRFASLQRSGRYSELRFIQRGKSSFDIVGYAWPDKGVRRRLGIGNARKNPSAFFTEKQLDGLRAAYASIRTAPISSSVKFRAMFAKMSDDQVVQLAGANVKFVSKLAVNEMIRRGIGKLNPTETKGATPNQVLFGMRGKSVVGWVNRETPSKYQVSYKKGAALAHVWRKKSAVKFVLTGKRGKVKNACPKTAEEVQNPSPALRSAIELSKKFHGFDPRKIKRVGITWPKALAVLGACARVDYLCDKHDGKPRVYYHNFEKQCELYAAPGSQPDGSSLLIIRGNFQIKPEGITG